MTYTKLLTQPSSIVASELLYGAYKKGSQKLIEVVKHFIDCFVIYDFDLKAAEEYALIRADLERNSYRSLRPSNCCPRKGFICRIGY